MSETREKASHVWARDEHDWYVEPVWTADRLFAVENFKGPLLDPACGEGRIVHAAHRAGLVAHGSDIVLRAPGFSGGFDFLDEEYQRAYHNCIVDIVSNPPYKSADEFVRTAIRRASGKIAMLLPAVWHLGDKRSRWLERAPLRRIWFLTPRPSLAPGAGVSAGMAVGGGTKDFAWYVFLKGFDGHPEVRWLHRDRDAGAT